MQKSINEYQLRVSKMASLPEPLNLGHDYEIMVTASIASKKDKDRQDGTYDVEYSARLLTAVIKTDKGEMKTLDKRKMSQKLRGCIYAVQSSEGIVMNEEEFYEKSMNYLINNLPHILRYGKVI